MKTFKICRNESHATEKRGISKYLEWASSFLSRQKRIKIELATKNDIQESSFRGFSYIQTKSGAVVVCPTGMIKQISHNFKDGQFIKTKIK